MVGAEFVDILTGGKDAASFISSLNTKSRALKKVATDEVIKTKLHTIMFEIRSATNKGECSTTAPFALIKGEDDIWDDQDVVDGIQKNLRAAGFTSAQVEHKFDIMWQTTISWDDNAVQKVRGQKRSAPGESQLQGECSICADAETRALQTLVPCGHCLCAYCAKKMLKKPCPICRTKIREVQNVYPRS